MMAQNFKENSNPTTGVSLCIPFVFKTVTKEKIFAVMRLMGVGHIERIDLVDVNDRQNKAFVHFAPEKWVCNEYGLSVLNTMKNGNPWEVYYNSRGYWKVYISACQKPAIKQQDAPIMVPRHRRRQVIDISAPVSHVSNQDYWNVGKEVMSIITSTHHNDSTMIDILSSNDTVRQAYSHYVEDGNFAKFKAICEEAMEEVVHHLKPSPLKRLIADERAFRENSMIMNEAMPLNDEIQLKHNLSELAREMTDSRYTMLFTSNIVQAAHAVYKTDNDWDEFKDTCQRFLRSLQRND